MTEDTLSLRPVPAPSTFGELSMFWYFLSGAALGATISALLLKVMYDLRASFVPTTIATFLVILIILNLPATKTGGVIAWGIIFGWVSGVIGVMLYAKYRS